MATFGVRLGELVREKRYEMGLTLEDLAHLAFGDIERKTRISELETGKVSRPQAKTVAGLRKALGLTVAEVEACRKGPPAADDPPAPVDDLPSALVENLALRFGHDNPDAPWDELAGFLKDKARDYREMQARLSALADAEGRIANLVGAAKAAIDAGRFDEADARLADVEALELRAHVERPVRRLADIRRERAETALLAQDIETATTRFEEAAAALGALAPAEGGRALNKGGVRLAEHGQRYRGPATAAAIRLFRSAQTTLTREAHPVDWATTQNNLAAALRAQGERTGGAEGAGLLAEAVAAYRALLAVRTREARPVQWAMTQAKICTAYEALAVVEPDAASAHLATALGCIDAALEVFDPETMPVYRDKAMGMRKSVTDRLAVPKT